MKHIVLAVVALLAAAPAYAADDCRLKLIADLDITTSGGGTLTVPVSIGGKEYPFVLNPQTVHTAITQHLADEIGAKTKPLGMEISYARERVTKVASVPDIQIGAGHAKFYNVLLLPDVPASGGDGYLGMDLLSSFDLELDLSARKLKLFSPDHCDGQVVYWNKPFDVLPLGRDVLGNLKIVMQLDGKPIKVGFAPQQKLASIGTSDANLLLGIASDDPKLTAVSDSDGAVYQKYPFSTLSVGGLTINNPIIWLYQQAPLCKTKVVIGSPDLARCVSSAPLLLGRNVLNALHLYFAFKEKNLYITAADTPPAAH